MTRAERRAQWSADIPWEQVKARAIGRRRWNTTQRYRSETRRLQIAKRIVTLRAQAWAGGSRSWVPRGVIGQLSQEFGVSKKVISKDLKIIDSWPDPAPPPPPRKRLRDPRFAWAYSRPRPTRFPKRITVRMDEQLYQQLLATGDPVGTLRKAAEAYLDTGSHHTKDACALVVAKSCDPETQDRLVSTAERLGTPLVQVLTSLLLVRAQEVSP